MTSKKPKSFGVRGKKVAVVGGGATALDCAVAAKLAGARSVEMIALENVGEMPLTTREKQDLVEHGIDVNGRMRVVGILEKGGKVADPDAEGRSHGVAKPAQRGRAEGRGGTEHAGTSGRSSWRSARATISVKLAGSATVARRATRTARRPW